MQHQDRSADLARPRFVGCACDRKFVEPTAVMLTSLDVNGDVPDATVIVAGFELTEDDKAMLRVGAGRLGTRMRFLDVTRQMLHGIDQSGYTDLYPVPVLGRLLVAGEVEVPGARMLTLDSDMIVRVSLRPLFDLDLGDNFFAAIHDPPRSEDPDYFNSGLTLFDVDTYRFHDIGTRALRWLATRDRHPTFPDQDALNETIGHLWHRLDRRWNWFGYSAPGFTVEEYARGFVAHFAGPKPWDSGDRQHPGVPMYDRYRNELHARMSGAAVGDAGPFGDAGIEVSGDMGVRVRHRGKDMLLVGYGMRGHAIYGPYEPVGAGELCVAFELALAGEQGEARPCAVLDVAGDDGADCLRRRTIGTEEVTAEPRTFFLRLTNDAPRRLEYRVETTGTADLLIGPPRLIAPAEMAAADLAWRG